MTWVVFGKKKIDWAKHYQVTDRLYCFISAQYACVCECVCILCDLGSLYYKTNEQQRSLDCSKTWEISSWLLDTFRTMSQLPSHVARLLKAKSFCGFLNLCCCCCCCWLDFWVEFHFQSRVRYVADTNWPADWLTWICLGWSRSVIASSVTVEVIQNVQSINSLFFFVLLIWWTTSWSETHALVEQEGACREYLTQLTMDESLKADLSCVTL